MKNSSKFLRHAAVACLGVVCLFLFANIVLRSFTDWNLGSESVSLDFVNFFWRENFQFFQLPHFNWHSDYLLYPYGVDITFIFWSFETNIFGAIAQYFNFAPWAQCYYVLSLAITFGGVYLLLWRRNGIAFAAFFAFVLTFCNYASICKYPGHFAHCIVHWGILSVVLDVILVEKILNNEHVSARYALTRVLVLFLCLGLELGYIAGFACLSFFLTCIYLLCAKLLQTRSFSLTLRWVCDELRNIVRTFGVSRCNWFLLIVIFIVAWVYLPIVFQIVTNTPTQEKTQVWATNPLRIFHPILPDYNPATTWVTKRGLFSVCLVDTIYAWSAGLSSVLMCYFGMVVGGRQKVSRWLPFMLLLAAALLMHLLPIITYFPAFKYARIPERLSPYLVCLLLIPVIVSVGQTQWQRCSKKLVVLITTPILLLWCVELATAYLCSDTVAVCRSILERFAPQQKDRIHAQPICPSISTFLWVDEFKISPFSSDYTRAVELVRRLPGDALFFLPFSVHGGDGKGLSDFHYITAHQMQFAARCGKKMNGCYLGRMFPEVYLKEFNKIPWADYMRGQDWTPAMWDVLTSFFKSANFSAVIIDKTAISRSQCADITDHLGTPVASFELFGQHYEVIPLPLSLRRKKE